MTTAERHTKRWMTEIYDAQTPKYELDRRLGGAAVVIAAEEQVREFFYDLVEQKAFETGGEFADVSVNVLQAPPVVYEPSLKNV